MKTIGILPAAGQGSRLGTIPCSKEIMPLGFHSHSSQEEKGWQPVTAIERHLQAFKVAGVQQIAIIIGGAKYDIMWYLGNGHRYGLNLTYLYQEQLWGMPFALDLAYPWLQNETVLFSMPDTLITPLNSMAKLLAQHQQTEADVTLGLFPTNTPHKFGMVEIEDNDRIANFIDKPTQTNLKFMWGYAAWSPRFTQFMHHYLQALTIDVPECVLSDVFLAALKDGLVIKQFIGDNGHYHDIGTPESFQSAVYELALQQISRQKSAK